MPVLSRRLDLPALAAETLWSTHTSPVCMCPLSRLLFVHLPPRYVLCVNSGEKVKNFKILTGDKGFTFNKKLYKNMESIVRSLKKEPLVGDNGKGFSLGGAAPKPQDEQEIIGEENEFEESVSPPLSAQFYPGLLLTPVISACSFIPGNPHKCCLLKLLLPTWSIALVMSRIQRHRRAEVVTMVTTSAAGSMRMTGRQAL